MGIREYTPFRGVRPTGGRSHSGTQLTLELSSLWNSAHSGTQLTLELSSLWNSAHSGTEKTPPLSHHDKTERRGSHAHTLKSYWAGGTGVSALSPANCPPSKPKIYTLLSSLQVASKGLDLSPDCSKSIPSGQNRERSQTCLGTQEV
jgi:hypothetical protein